MVESQHPYTAINDIEHEEQRARSRKRMIIGCTVFVLIAAVIGAIVGALVVGGNKHTSSQQTSSSTPTTPITSTSPIVTSTTPNTPVSPTTTTTTTTTTTIKSTCSMPNYISKDNNIYSVSLNGTKIPIQIKGINWFGMETKNNIPFGLWDNGINGSSMSQIGKFLVQNKFNSVRLPICIYSILQNSPPRKDLINLSKNAGIKVDTYMNLLQSIILSLGSRGISVVISLHTLMPSTLSPLWYSNEIPETDVLKAIGNLTTTFCSPLYWNILGIDVKNEPSGATWGDGSATDFQAGATRLGNKILEGCSSWLIFVQGIAALDHNINAEGMDITYGDWWGGGLQNARDNPVQLSIPNKVVYAPHYYPPSVYPHLYFYGDNYAELSDDTLEKVVRLTMDDMFGYLATSQSNALVVGEFGGLYTTDKHPQKTMQRVIQYNIQLMQRTGWSGGYLWALNPESLYQYNPFNTEGDFYEGIFEIDWKTVNQPYVDALKGLDAMPNLRMFPCFSN